jgi:hypothetical protein
MADLLVERLTGQTSAGAVPVEIGLIMTDRALLHGDGEPAILEGYGPLPAATARDLLTAPTDDPPADPAPADPASTSPAPADDVPVWLRQLYTHPETGELVAMSSRRRCYAGALRRFIRYRDQYCRTPYCGAPIRHLDHVQPAARGGATTAANAQGLCQACNHAKQAPGWATHVTAADGPHTVEITTPTGHRYHSRAPDPPGTGPQTGTRDDAGEQSRYIAETRWAV